jgi:Tfp pilus assembly protein PilV
VKRRGDTLIEVLFAFAILATIIGFSFTGALAGYKSALAAQNRTQATLVAQYQADGLKTYRDSLDWESVEGSPSFLGGFASSPRLESMSQIIDDNNKKFCMKAVVSKSGLKALPVWRVNTIPASCRTLAKELAPNLDDPQIEISLKRYQSDSSKSERPDKIVATVVVSWQPRNTNIREQVTNTIILTKEE